MSKKDASLRGVTPPLAGTQFLIDVEHFSIGRSADCNLVIDEKTISAVHAVIKITEHGYNLIDQNSTNGTFVNDRRINSIYLNDGDLVRLDDIEFQFKGDGKPRYLDPDLLHSQGSPQPKAPKPVKQTKRNHAVTSRNGFRKPARRTLGVALAFAVILICFISGVVIVTSGESGNRQILARQVISATPLMHTHFYYEDRSTEELGRSIIIGSSLLLGLAAAGLGFRLISSLSAPEIALYVGLTYALLLFFGHLAALGFDISRLEKSVTDFLNMNASSVSQLGLVYLFVFATGFVISLSTASLLKR